MIPRDTSKVTMIELKVSSRTSMDPKYILLVAKDSYFTTLESSPILPLGYFKRSEGLVHRRLDTNGVKCAFKAGKVNQRMN